MSKARVFGQQVIIEFSFDGSTVNKVAEIDNFSSKHNDIVKKNSSLGENGTGTIDVLDDGGSGSFEAKKSDSLMSAFFVAQSNQNRANGIAGERGKTPYIQIVKTITLLDGSKEVTTYEGVVIHSPEDSIGGRTEEVVEKFEMEYKTRDIKVGAGEASATGLVGVGYMTTALSKLDALVANVTPIFVEGKATTYATGTSVTKG